MIKHKCSQLPGIKSAGCLSRDMAPNIKNNRVAEMHLITDFTAEAFETFTWYISRSITRVSAVGWSLNQSTHHEAARTLLPSAS